MLVTLGSLFFPLSSEHVLYCLDRERINKIEVLVYFFPIYSLNTAYDTNQRNGL